MTKKLKKSLATLLAMSMILSMASVSAFATDGDELENNEPVIEDAVTVGENNENTPEICETCGKALTECEGHEDQTDPADTSEENEEEEEEQPEENLCEHEWNEGEAVEGGTKYTCALCGESHVLADEDNSFDTDTLEEAVEENGGIDWTANEITIMTVDELIEFADQVNGGTTFQGKTVTLGDDIDLSNEAWTPIGSNSKPFEGTFDGGDHTISNLNVTGDGYVGLFGYIGGNAGAHDLPEIKNLTVENVTVSATGNNVGGVVGNAFVAKVTNVHVMGTVDIEGRGYVGGIVGHGYVKVDNCSVEAGGTIKSNFWCVGGIIGYGGEGFTAVTDTAVDGGTEGLTITSAAGAVAGIIGRAEDNNGSQPCSGSGLSVRNVNISTFTGAYGDGYADNGLAYFFGGDVSTGKLTGALEAENVTVVTSTGASPTISDIVAEINGKYYGSLQAAIDAATEGQTVTLVKDTNVDRANEVYGVKIWADCDITLDLNGKTLDGAIWNYGTLTITGNGTVDNTGNEYSWPAVENWNSTAKLTIENGEFVGSTDNALLNSNGAEATINGGTYSGGFGSVLNNNGGGMTINNGTFQGCVRNGLSDDPQPSTMTVNNGTFNAETANALGNAKGTVTINGGSFTGGTGYASVENQATMVIKAGTFDRNQNNGPAITNVQTNYGSTADLTIIGGTFSGWCPDNTSNKVTCSAIQILDNAKTNIQGGTFTGIDGAIYCSPALAEGTKFISGGTFSSDVNAYVVEGSQAEEADGVWTIVPAEDSVAAIGNKGYASLQAAIDAAGTTAATVELLKSTTESVVIAAGQNITLDLNGKTLRGSSVNADYAAITVDGTKIGKGTVTNCGTLTIIDSSAATEEAAMGKIVGVNVVTNANTGATSGKIALVNMPNATCTIKSGMITRAPYLDETKTQNNGQTSNYTVQNMGTMNIEGGLIVNNSTYSNLVVNYTKKGNSYVNGFNAEMNISGGTLRQDTMSALKNDPGAVMNISGDAAVVWRVASENNYATNFYGTVNMTGGTIKTNGVIPLFTWKEGTTEFPAQFNISGNAKLECNVLESNNGVMGGYNDAYVINQQPVINISGNPTITVNRMQTVCSVDNVMIRVENGTKATINVEGGTFSSPVDSQYCAEGYLPIANEDGTYGVTDTLTLSQTTLNMTVGYTTSAPVPLTVTPEVEVEWTSSNPSVATVANGVVTPVAVGSTTITAVVNGLTSECVVTVRNTTAPYVPPTPSTPDTGDEDLEDPDTPLADRPWLFTDVKEGDYFYDAVKRLFDKGIVGGKSDTIYAPYEDATRGMVAQILYGMAGSPDVTGLEMPFTDVKESDFYYKAVLWGYANKVLGGYPEDNTFRGENTITREELAALLHQYGVEKLGLADTKSELDGFIDTDKISGWAVEHIKWAVGVEIMHGDNAKKLMPKDNTIRADMTIMLNNLDQMIGEEK